MSKELFLQVVALILLIFASLFIGGIVFGLEYEDPQHRIDLINTILGFVLGTVVASVIGYYFGTSQGSKDKDAVIARSQPPMPDPAERSDADSP